MPLYDYLCTRCGPFERQVALAEYRSPQSCPDCSSESQRIIGQAPQLPLLDAATRTAHAVNERSAHEPRAVGRRQHGAGCSCCAGTTQREARPGATKGFPAKRPWMISH